MIHCSPCTIFGFRDLLNSSSLHLKDLKTTCHCIDSEKYQVKSEMKF